MNYTVIIVACLALVAVVLLAKMLTERTLKLQAMDNGKAVKGIVLPLRLQAYERMALYLERIEPTQLVMRIHAPGLTVAQEQNLLLTAIRSEFEHNLSQQIYISNPVWKQICNAKDDITEIVNTVAEQMEDGADGQQFAEALLIAAAQKPVVDQALETLKADIQKMF
ncbi:MAG: hypothetical protein IJQ94_02785 [Bacteroidales bacterium]|jgi:hypothetical protein|nr:hypothetical protein [Bacteroidales bacterium]MBR0304553.1 hypothetical protein [Bacteroidales bacterium]